jgi:hypothetical protein
MRLRGYQLFYKILRMRLIKLFFVRRKQKIKGFGFLAIAVLTIFNSCESPEIDTVDSDIPLLRLEDIQFKAANSLTDFDSLNIKLYVEDRSFDIGLPDSDKKFPFNQYFFFRKPTGEKIPSVVPTNKNPYGLPLNKNELINFFDRRTRSNDTLPTYKNCGRYLIITEDSGFTTDTLYYLNNKNYNNLRIDFYAETDNEFKKFDILEGKGFCYSFDARYDVWTTSTPKYLRMFTTFINGKRNTAFITYRIVLGRGGFNYFFPGKKVKLKIKIIDRDFNESNEVESPPIQF